MPVPALVIYTLKCQQVGMFTKPIGPREPNLPNHTVFRFKSEQNWYSKAPFISQPSTIIVGSLMRSLMIFISPHPWTTILSYNLRMPVLALQTLPIIYYFLFDISYSYTESKWCHENITISLVVIVIIVRGWDTLIDTNIV